MIQYNIRSKTSPGEYIQVFYIDCISSWFFPFFPFFPHVFISFSGGDRTRPLLNKQKKKRPAAKPKMSLTLSSVCSNDFEGDETICFCPTEATTCNNNDGLAWLILLTFVHTHIQHDHTVHGTCFLDVYDVCVCQPFSKLQSTVCACHVSSPSQHSKSLLRLGWVVCSAATSTVLKRLKCTPNQSKIRQNRSCFTKLSGSGWRKSWSKRTKLSKGFAVLWTWNVGLPRPYGPRSSNTNTPCSSTLTQQFWIFHNLIGLFTSTLGLKVQQLNKSYKRQLMAARPKPMASTTPRCVASKQQMSKAPSLGTKKFGIRNTK